MVQNNISIKILCQYKKFKQVSIVNVFKYMQLCSASHNDAHAINSTINQENAIQNHEMHITFNV